MLTNEQRTQLIRAARDARNYAYAPYSQYRVGAALLATSGQIYTGVNVENAAYPITMCAERVALFKAVSEGARSFVAIAVVTQNAGSSCGACRQALSEFGKSTIVLFADVEGDQVEETTVGDLLPGAFGPGDLRVG
ncbi:MAG: cytidine deaminase [Chloroflexota bacterium]